jgi:predicted  nucleic acid-binding Zn-ribbon protein
MRKIFDFLSDLCRQRRAHSVQGRIHTLESRILTLESSIHTLEGRIHTFEGRIAKHLEDVNFSLGALNEHILEEIRSKRQSDGAISKIITSMDNKVIVSMDNMNKNITELFECLIEFNRVQKALIARLEKHGLKDL